MSNKQNGNRFEQELAAKLAKYGFWVHVMQQNKAGQPADIIAVGKHLCTMIDCKDVESGDSFRLSRVEENQKLAMSMFEDKTDRECWFAIRFCDGEIYMLSWDYIDFYARNGFASIRRTQMDMDLDDPEEWVHTFEHWIMVQKY